MSTKLYTCHLCAHEFDAWPDLQFTQDYEALTMSKQRIDEVPEGERNPYAPSMSWKCPNCGEIYNLNIQTDPPTLIP